MYKFLSLKKRKPMEIFQRKWGFHTDNLVITNHWKDGRNLRQEAGISIQLPSYNKVSQRKENIKKIMWKRKYINNTY